MKLEVFHFDDKDAKEQDVPIHESHESYAESLDAEFFDVFKENYTEDYQHLVCNPEQLDEQKRAFMEGEIDNPTLEYPELWQVDFLEKEMELADLRETIENSDCDEEVRGAYLFKIDEQIDTLKMLQAARDQDDESFTEFSAKIYGEPSVEVYAYTLKRVKEFVDEAITGFDEQNKEAALRLQETILKDEIMNIDTSDLDSLAAEMRQKFELKDVGTEPLPASEIQVGFEKKLNEYGIEGWQVVVDETGKYRNLGVNQETKTAYIPNDEILANRKDPITAERLEMLAAHELGTHALRRENGEQSPLQLLGFGLDSSLSAEEGIAKHSEQKIGGFDDFSNNIGYLKTGLVMGLDGTKRNFAELYKVMVDFERITAEEGGEDAERLSRERAWEGCVRTFRGTTGQTPGTCFTKDIVYREGNVQIWKLLRDHPEMEQYFMLGKYDPTNKRHVALLKQLDIISSE